jgi:hypothetical protein
MINFQVLQDTLYALAVVIGIAVVFAVAIIGAGDDCQAPCPDRRHA